MKMYHVCDGLKALFITKEGLKPNNLLRGVPTSSDFSDGNYVYLWESLSIAKTFKKAMEERADMRIMILEMDIAGLDLEKDLSPYMINGAFKFRGIIKEDRVKVMK